MRSHLNPSDLSDLEREFELDMEDQSPEESEAGDSVPNGSATGDYELDEDFESFRDDSGETEDSTGQEDSETQTDESDGYAERFYELSLREFESDNELQGAVRNILDDLEKEYFFGKIASLAKRAAKTGVGRLVKKGVALAGKLPAFQGVKAITQMAREGLKGPLGAMIMSAFPGGAAALPILQSLGIRLPGGLAERETFEDLAVISREAFEHLATNLTEKADQPAVAAQLAAQALQTAVANGAKRRHSDRSGRSGKVKRVTLGPGEKLIVVRRS